MMTNILKRSILALLFVLAFSLGVFAQNVTLKMQNATLVEFFNEIEKQTDYHISYRVDIIGKSRDVNISVDNVPVAAAFDQVLVNRNLKYEIISPTSIVVSEKVLPKEAPKGFLAKGKVLDEAGDPVIGAGVVEGKTRNGTITDVNGDFTLNVSSPDAELEVSCIGFSTKTVAIQGQGFLNIVLGEDKNLLDEVVVVGFGSQKKINLTGAVGVVESSAIESRPIVNTVQALQGVLPGLNITVSGNGGELNSTPDINIRGTATIGSASSGSPLVLIDGMEGSLTNINPQDIDNISVLKDAAASSIYGSRAPFGVILVTTKSGVKGKAKVNYTNNFQFKTPVHLPEMANSYEYMVYFNDANYNNAGSILWTEENVQKALNYINGDTADGGIAVVDGKWDTRNAWANLDWLRVYFDDWAPSQEHNISVSGGSDRVTYYISANYQGQTGFLRYGTDYLDRFATTGKISAQVTDFIKADYSIRFSRRNYDRAADMSSDFYKQVLRRAVPNVPFEAPDGNRFPGVCFTDILEQGGRTTNLEDDLYQQLRLTVTPIENWNIIAEVNARTIYDWDHTVRKIVYDYYANSDVVSGIAGLSQKNSSVSEASTFTTHFTPNLYTNYNISLGKNNFAATAGVQIENWRKRYLSAQRNDLISDEIEVLDQTTDIANATVKGNTDLWRTIGFFGRLNYDYDGRYLLEMNVRRDGSSRYRAGSRWITSPSFSFGWNVAREPWMQSASRTVSLLKIRASYGFLANQNAKSYYPTYTTLKTTSGGGTWLIDGSRPNIAAVPGLTSSTLTWEKIKSLNVGLDWGLFNNRFTGSFDAYNRKTEDMMGPGIDLPATLGTSVPNTNNTDLQTVGWELQLGWKDVIRDFSYGFSFNLSDSKTTILKYPNLTNSISTYYDGKVLGEIWGFETIGVARDQEEMDAHLASLPNGGQNAVGSKWSAGDIMFKDIDGDGKISTGSKTLSDHGDLFIIGNDSPRFRTGLTMNASWKGLGISLFWQGVLKRDFYPIPDTGTTVGSGTDVNFVFWGATRGGRFWSNCFKNNLDYWRDESSMLGENRDAYYPRPLWADKNKATQTRYLQDASYIRLKNLQVYYYLPEKWMNAVKIQSLRLYASFENLLTFTHMSTTMDPELAGLGMQGGMAYPLSKVYSFGLNVTF